MDRRAFMVGGVAMLVAPFVADAQHSRLYQIGVIVLGGTHLSTIEGLRHGLRELGLEEGKQYVFHVHDGKGDLKSVEAVARRLEDVQQVDALVTVSTSVTLAAKRATKSVPIVFYAGTDPVSSGLIDSFRRPGGRSTGIHRQSTDLTAKRLELLKEIVPTLRRVVTFYRADNPIAQASVKIARDAARQLKVELVERPVASVGELRASLRALRPGEADALFLVSDAMVSSQTELLIEMATTKRLPTMVQEGASVGNGALAAYGESFYTVGRLSAKHVQRILQGAKPGDLPVEQVKNVYFMINLKTAKALGLTIPPSLLLRADQVIE
jgi:putative tryptophan/tyrosine transport system substrate-binding protein